MPVWLKENQYRSPTEGTNAPFGMGFNTDLHFFEWVNANPKYPKLAGQFNNFMSAYHQGRPSWMDDGFYPVSEQLIKGAKQGDNEVLLVDVGGGKGHDLQEFRSKCPDSSSGRLILQDQPTVLDDVEELDSSIERMAHDFFTEQPIKGRFFLLVCILPKYQPVHGCQMIDFERVLFVGRCTSIFPTLRHARLARRGLPNDPP